MLKLDHQGWILSPNETKKQLLSRKAFLEKNSKNSSFPNHKAHDLTESLYQFRLPSIDIFYSKESIAPWQGALLWSYQEKGEEPFPVIQIRKKGLLKEDEILAHELVHAARFSFKEPFFEEVLAYQTSSSLLYKLLGPLFMFEKEPLIYLILSFTTFFAVIYLEDLSFLWIPSLAFGFLLIRLALVHCIFSLAKKKIRKMGITNPLPILLRLSDKEIVKSALSSPKKILQKEKKDLRLKEVLSHYIKN